MHGFHALRHPHSNQNSRGYQLGKRCLCENLSNTQLSCWCCSECWLQDVTVQGPDRFRCVYLCHQVRMMSTTAAVVSYVRLTQKVVNCIPETHAVQETRVWEEKDGKWVSD